MLIQVLGPGCAKCDNLAVQADEAAKKLGVEYTLEKVTDITRIIEFGVLTTPALIVDGKIKCSGSAPGIDKIEKMLKDEL